jgi:hypothetical protein
VNFSFRLVPNPLTTAMIASEMPAAIRPYSIAVAPDSSDKNLKNTLQFRLHRDFAEIVHPRRYTDHNLRLRKRHLQISRILFPVVTPDHGADSFHRAGAPIP